MGFLDKILGGTKTSTGITDDINNEAQKSKQRIADGERERAEREKLGQEIEQYYIGESRRKDFPYDCFFEWEFEMVEKALQADDSLKGILDIIMCARDYIMNNRNLGIENDVLKKFNVNHSKIWIEMLIKRARNGSCYAKAAQTVDKDHLQNKRMVFSMCIFADELLTGYSGTSSREQLKRRIIHASGLFCPCLPADWLTFSCSCRRR